MSKYDVLKEMISEWIELETENYKEAKNLAGINSCGACMAAGAVDAYKQVMSDIAELEAEVVVL